MVWFGLPQNPTNLVISSLPPFPLLGAYLIGGSVLNAYGTTAYQQKVALCDVAVIGLYPGWTSGSFNQQTAAAAVKGFNPSIKLTLYMKLNSAPSSWASGSPYTPLYSGIVSNNYWVRATYPSGSIETDFGGTEQCMNIFDTGYQTFGTNFYLANQFSSNYDGMYVDNFYYQPRTVGDYLKNGTTQSIAASAQGWRNGYAAIVAKLRAGLPPGAQVWGNTADWANGAITGYNQLLDGGVIESLIGQSYSYETQGWGVMMNAYKIIMNATTAGAYQIFEQDGTATDYQGMRYGLASCALDNGYYYFNVNGPGGGAVVTTFDEFNFNLGSPIPGPNNPSNGIYSSGGITVWSQGVYRRDFSNGLVLVNPRGNGPQTVALGGTFWKLRGTQAPTINNAQQVTSVTLSDRDGLVLSRSPT